MGCCFSKKSATEDDKVALKANETHGNVTSKIGKHGDEIKIEHIQSNNFYSIRGKGTAVGSCFLECDTAYWEVRINDNPSGICIGIKRNDKNLNGFLDTDQSGTSPSVEESWYFKCNSESELKSGDVIGVHWDQTALPMLSFTLNGNDVSDRSYLRVRPANNILPAVSLKEGSSCDFIFDGNHFLQKPKASRFGAIICATSLI